MLVGHVAAGAARVFAAPLPVVAEVADAVAARVRLLEGALAVEALAAAEVARAGRENALEENVPASAAADEGEVPGGSGLTESGQTLQGAFSAVSKQASKYVRIFTGLILGCIRIRIRSRLVFEKKEVSKPNFASK